MDESNRQRYETQAKDLRVKIKAWEVEFYNAHDGTKPSRTDIKESHMSGTYKEYQRLRDILDGKTQQPPTPKAKDHTNLRKRKSPQQPPATLTPCTKRFKVVETPSSRRERLGDSIALNMFTPGRGTSGSSTPSLSRKLFDSPAIPTSIGPTPQRDGRVLGLFDSLPFKDADIDSPCKPNGAVRLSQVTEAGREFMTAAAATATATPRKTVAGREPGSAALLGRTPSSRHKRHGDPSPRKSILSTPLKLGGGGGDRVAKTPGTSNSVSKLQFQTPAFLRRIPMPKINENSEFVSPEPIRLPRKPLLRGLSSVVADLRKMQEEELDDDLDALREAEMDGPSKPVNRTILSDKTNLPLAATIPTTTEEKQDGGGRAAAADDSILAEDSEKQALGLLGGFDNEAEYDSAGEQDAGLDRNGNPLRVYKKKGQKRTTRRSNMKPVMKRRPAAAIAAHVGEDEEVTDARNTGDDVRGNENDDDDDEDNNNPSIHSGSDFVASGDEHEDDDELAQDFSSNVRQIATRKKSTTAKKTTTTTTTATSRKKKLQAAPPPTGTAAKKAAPRKVNELAHANFKRLKLRNNGAKGGPGHNSRFRRRR